MSKQTRSSATDTRLVKLSYLLIADDDTDDQVLIRDALQDTGMSVDKIRFVNDGEELLSALNQAKVLPYMILLDLNMPLKDGKEALFEIKTNERLKHIPVIIFTTSSEELDIKQCYSMGSNAYMTKPSSYHELVEYMETVKHFWLERARVALS